MNARSSNNLAARMGRWSARHRKIAIFGWLAFVVLAFVLGGVVGTKQLSDADKEAGESGRAAQIYAHAGFDGGDPESILVQSAGKDVRSAAFRAAVRSVAATLSRQRWVSELRSPYAEGNRGQISRDGHSALVQFRFGGGAAEVGHVLRAVKQAARDHPGFYVGEYGDASATKAFSDTQGNDLHRAEYLSIPLTFAILLIAFGAVVAATIPLLLALSAVFATFGLLSLPSQIWPASDAANTVILLIGLAVGVDYSLFYIRRERQEQAHGKEPAAALEAAAATSGRAVLLSGVVVLIAMAGMFLTGNKVFTSIAVGTMLVVAISVAGSLTVLPAVISKLGNRVEKGRLPLLGRRRLNGESRLLGWLIDRVLRRPLLAIVLAGGALVALALPAFALHTNDAGQTALPQHLPIAKTYERIQQAFPGGAQPAYVVVKAPNVKAPKIRQAVAELRRRALASGEMENPIAVDTNAQATVSVITVPLVGSGTDGRSEHALALLRRRILPASFGRVGGVETAVTGLTASSKDFNDLLKSRLPIVFAFVLGLAFLLLLVAFRSIVVALKAIVLNLLSVGAAYGLLVSVFQWGWGESLLQFKSTHGITLWLPLFLFVVLFGLSMDYHVLILTRVREAVDQGMKTEQAVAQGIKTTAGPITSAAIVMVAVFAVFATLSQIELKQLGVGLAAAILIDATLIRAVLLPATMTLLGDRNWYLPSWLEWLPRISHEAEVSTAIECTPVGAQP